jgi:hypothetical protein
MAGFDLVKPDHDGETVSNRNEYAPKEKRTMTRSTTSLQLALAWGFVGVPLAWGVMQTVLNAMKLFQ